MHRGEPAHTGFFADKNRAFWILQCGGWAGYFVLRALGGLANRMGLDFILPVVLVTLTGFSITLLMGWAYRIFIGMRPIWTWTLTLAVLAIASILFSVLEVWAHATFYQPGWRPQGIEFLGAILLTLAVLGAWTGLYFGINYHLLLTAQEQSYAQLASEANRAQLAMLRYQLNPHFLFNTLNSISTLVMLKETERANLMLSRLSSFLRYTLVGERAGMATVDQEMEAIRLYLDIERIRFGDRLRVHFDIEPAARSARIPSLLLQPLVENAVKYAVTPREQGASMTIAARVDGPWLVVTVEDDGPGLPPGGPGPTGDNTGVGLDNIRERLWQAFGTDHRFELISPAPGSSAVQAADSSPGLMVVIALPLEVEASAGAGAEPPPPRPAAAPAPSAALPAAQA